MSQTLASKFNGMFCKHKLIPLLHRKLIGENRREFGNRYIFDGASIYLTQNTPDKEIKTSFDGKPMAILIRRTGTVKSSDPSAFQLFNLIFREAMAELKLQNIRRDYFDPHAKVIFRCFFIFHFK